MKRPVWQIAFAIFAFCAAKNISAQEVVRCGEASYASYAPWRLARTANRRGDQSRFMQTRPLYLAPEAAERVKKGEQVGTMPEPVGSRVSSIRYELLINGVPVNPEKYLPKK